jgi:predicted Zn-dependent peptidase
LRLLAVALLAAGLSAGALGPSLARAATTPATAAETLQVPRIDYRERKLGNGLTVLSVESHASPTVSVQVWYHVGGADDPEGKSGFAHLFEHMMFKGSKYMKSEQFDRLTEDVGGENNASTSEDVTAYQAVVPSNHLETLLWAEAERLLNLKVDEANFLSERAVVQEEYRQRILASPYGRFFEEMSTKPYLRHPYRRGVIGSIENLDAAAVADVVAFHATYYRPDNATLIVTGDFDPRQLDAWVDKYFGPIPGRRRRCRRARRPSRRGRPTERSRSARRTCPCRRWRRSGWRRRSPTPTRRRCRSRRPCSRPANRRASTRRWSIASRSRPRRASTPTCAPDPAS